jgi:hypothetical protein
MSFRITNFQYNNVIWVPQIYCTGCIYNAWTNNRSEFPHTKTRHKVHINICLQTPIFQTIVPTFARPQPLGLLSVGTLKNKILFCSNWKWRDTSPTHSPCLSIHLQALRDLSKGVTVHDWTCPCVHCFRWMIFWEFTVNCSLINNNNSTVFKLGTSTVNVLCQLQVKHYSLKAFIVTFNLSVKLKTAHFRTCVDMNFFFVLMWSFVQVF